MKLRKIHTVIATFFIVCFTSLSTIDAIAQNVPVSQSDKIVENPDIVPMFTGGTAEMHRFISNTLSYPADAAERNAQGLVVYTFVVEKDGSLSNFNIIHRADPLLNEEALRILKNMPPWRPARHNGEIVRSETYVPMYFKLNKNVQYSTRTSSSATARAYAKTDQSILENSEIYTIVDKMPVYEYGEKELANFISYNMRYPKEALQQGIEGRILCSFIVGKDGSISNIEVVSGSNEALNNEAIRVLGLMPKWTPGENNGEKVNVKCLLPIDFTIDEQPIPPLTSSN
ncbi:MAG TPA: energy transducer TonB [Fermentimonas caenicola]|jgi:protein TonB|uniref:Putative secreted protein n=1 Tax=Fermentimonas caenicola TaxID=1562970 RepID=A0A098BXY6_9BACT|nr:MULTISPECIES: energy transducer TonB [Lascolabacillus]MBP6174684.1 energy transducer TonB [Fermentimonas sp.]MDI9625027.1 energy transducer TonB [Bacteroidota bacterium]TAH61615.1 MAG: energy transducer TonB [Fermentimonas caenicola]MBP6195914.1 energy transducer TonB [Fermentimonas sp.]MBP7103814.1 energy transducer TonB [Fermentimonas sp.]